MSFWPIPGVWKHRRWFFRASIDQIYNMKQENENFWKKVPAMSEPNFVKGILTVFPSKKCTLTKIRSDFWKSDLIFDKSDLIFEIWSDFSEIRSDFLEIRSDFLKIRSDFLKIRSDFKNQIWFFKKLDLIKKIRSDFLKVSIFQNFQNFQI